MSDRQLRLQVVLGAVDKLTRPFQGASDANKRLAETLKQSRQQLRDLNQQASKIDGFRKTKQALTRAQDAYRNATDRVAALSQVINASSNPTQAQRRELQQAMRAAGQLKDKTQSLSQSLQRQRDVLSASGISTRNLGDAQRQLNRDISRTTQTLQQQQQQLERLNQQQQRMAAAKARYQQMKDVRNQMAGTGATAIATGVGALYSAKRVMLPGYDFETGMSKVQALTRLDKNAPELKQLREQARHLGATTAFTANQVAQGQSFYAMAGFKPGQIRAAMPGTLAMSLAGDTDLATTADIGSNILTGFKLKSDDMGRVSDVLVGAFTRSNTNLSMLGETMKYVAPVAAGLGVDIETAAAATGKLGDAGIQGSMAGTALRSILGRLAEPPTAAAKALKKLSIQTKDAKGNLRALPDILTELNAKTAKMGNAQRAGIFKAIAGEEAFSALSVLAEQAGSGALQKLTQELKQAQGEAKKVADTMTDNLDGDLKALSSAWDDLGIQIFGGVDSPLRGIAKRITRIISKTGEWMKANPELTKTLTMVGIGLGVILTVFGAITLALAAFLGPLAMVKFGLSILGIKGAGSLKLLGGAFKILAGVIRGTTALMMANPILAILGMIALAAWLIYDNWDTLVPWFKKLWASISSYVSTAWQNIRQTLLNKWEEIKQDTQNKWEGIKKALANKWDEIVEDTQKLPEKFKQFGTEIIDKLIAGIKDKWQALKQSIANLGTEIKDAITPDFMKTQAEKPEVKKALDAYNAAAHPAAGFFGAFDRGGTIPAGKFGLVGEHGPELINGPARVTSRRQTATLARMAAAALSMGAASTVSAQPLHPYSLPAAQYQNAGVTVINQPQRPERPVYEIHIHATSSQSEQDIARAVARELDRREHQQRARARSAYADREEF
ncbi:TP901 family phage tail tape measure protein [Xenorhabdus cabanillasii]|uniref:TP901 family phage tail tape measure protein n=1 Tax=Xenorhabdus cabanillasii TaxID=351673 RepID=A0A3D9UUV1_9GAMM|nr:phage tail tape measure protein [Xenorhabdus cabanillasii]REF28521.1 TP901 family phage tail tape measure protein [Xenorhabdus cabanillasii]